MKAMIALANGNTWCGEFFGHHGKTSGEAVFSTAMTGYPESLSDPSYYGQILVLSYPIVGNYGVPSSAATQQSIAQFFESEKPHIRALVVDHYSHDYHHWNAEKSLSEWLAEHHIVGIEGVDTREITQQLRDEGNMLACIYPLGQEEDPKKGYDPQKQNIVREVACTEKIIYPAGEKRVILVDCGTKNNIIRSLLKRNLTVIRVPYDYDYSNETYDAVFISNGPGNPIYLTKTIAHIQKSIQENKVVFGICLGCQLIGLAVGASILKLKFGHRSHNQPVMEISTKRCYITSQNHSYALDIATIPPPFVASYINLNDQTCEGIQHQNGRIAAVQFHPESFGGPEDTDFFFDQLVETLSSTQA